MSFRTDSLVTNLFVTLPELLEITLIDAIEQRFLQVLSPLVVERGTCSILEPREVRSGPCLARFKVTIAVPIGRVAMLARLLFFAPGKE